MSRYIKCSFPFGFDDQKFAYVSHASSRVTCSAHRILLDFITLFGEDLKIFIFEILKTFTFNS